MSISHHSDQERLDLIRRFVQHAEGAQVNRQWPEGRIGAHDEGQIEFAIAADPGRQLIHISFPKAIRSLAMSVEDATKIREMLDEKLLELRGITPVR